MRVETPAEQLLFCTLRLETNGGVGTAFIVEHQWREDRQGLLLVTNKHVVDGSDRGVVRFTESVSAPPAKTEPKLGSHVGINLQPGAWNWVGHPDNEVDVAALPLASLFPVFQEAGKWPFFKNVHTRDFPNEAALDELDAVEEVMFVGYPNGMFDTVHNLPIARRGSTATPAGVDWNGAPVFLIDASVFPGSSGSPVFICNTGFWAGRRGTTVGSRLIFLGIIASVFFRKDDGDIEVRDVPTAMRPVVTTTQMIDLGIVFKPRTIVETIDELLRQRGEI